MIKILYEFFYVLTGALIIFCAMEIVCPRVVLAYININLVLLFWFLAGIVILVENKKEIKKH